MNAHLLGFLFLSSLNILEFNGPLITDEYYERTSAISLVTPIMSALFMKSRSLATKWFEIQTKLTNRHLFDVVIFYEGMDEPLALGEFAGPTQGNEKTEYDTVKVYRNGMRIINEVAHKTKNGKIPRVFIVLFQKAKLHFETLSLIDNCTYVRARYATLKAPSTPEELIKVFMNISKVISWRDALVESTTAIRTNDDSACSSQDPDCTLDTSSVSSSQ